MASADGQSISAAPRPSVRDRGSHDARLTQWLKARAGTDADRMLTSLLEEVALPVITGIVRGKFGRANHGADAEDAVSEARFQVIRYLQRLREGSPDGERPPGVDLPAYVATVTYSVWANHLRRRHPARALLANRLRYLLENRAGPQGFALWHGDGGERLAGFSTWRERRRVSEPAPRRQWLLTDPPAAAADAFGGAHRVPADLAALTAGLFVWLNGPLELSGLVGVLAELLGLSEPFSPPSDGEEDAAFSTLSPDPSPHDTLRWKEYLGWLWRQVMGLPLGQRTAFLCHSSLLREMELCGLTSIRAAAAALEIPPARMAEIWSRLPINDLEIAALLGSDNRQQVINLRKTARATLGSAWRKAQEP